MNANINIKANNTYDVALIDSRTGEVRQSGSFHNIVLNSIKRMLVFSSGTKTAFEDGWLTHIFEAIRCGSGTTPPTAADTALANPLWSTFTPDSNTDPIVWPAKGVARRTRTYTVPAGLDYVGTVTEIGLHARVCGPNSYWKPDIGALCTRALLTDSEGQIISFNKTDLDILKITVTVELSLVSSSEDFVVFSNPLVLSNILAFAPSGNVNPPFWPHGGFEVRRFAHDCKNDIIIGTEQSTDISAYGKPVAIDQALPLSYLCTNDGERLGIDWPKVRLTSDTVTEERYYNNLVLTGLGGWPLPNENIFPAYSIKNIPIGTGDGVTKAFTSPLSYFKKDTDKVYKNGVLLTRNVDYTLNYTNNAKKLDEISDLLGTLPEKAYVASDTPRKITGALPILIGALQPYRSAREGFVYFFNSSAPVTFTYDNPVTLNYFHGGNICYMNSGGGTSVAAYTFTLESSDDGVTYTEVATATGPDFEASFVDTTAKYWQIKTNCPVSNTIYLNNPGGYLTVGYSDPYVTFAEVPAEGDILTMDVEMDVIMKNSNFVVDAEASIDFTIGG